MDTASPAMVWFQTGRWFLKWLNMLWYLSSQLFPAIYSIGQNNLCIGIFGAAGIRHSEETVPAWLQSTTTRLFILSDIRLYKLACRFSIICSVGKWQVVIQRQKVVPISKRRSKIRGPGSQHSRLNFCLCSFCGPRWLVTVSKHQKFWSRRLNILYIVSADFATEL